MAPIHNCLDSSVKSERNRWRVSTDELFSPWKFATDSVTIIMILPATKQRILLLVSTQNRLSRSPRPSQADLRSFESPAEFYSKRVRGRQSKKNTLTDIFTYCPMPTTPWIGVYSTNHVSAVSIPLFGVCGRTSVSFSTLSDITFRSVQMSITVFCDTFSFKDMTWENTVTEKRKTTRRTWVDM